MSEEFDFESFLRGKQRQTDLKNWLNGKGELTEEEKAYAATFKGPDADLYARKAISLRRRTQAVESLGGDGPYSELEQEYKSQFLSGDADLASKKAIGIKRKTRLHKYLSGDKNENLDK